MIIIIINNNDNNNNNNNNNDYSNNNNNNGYILILVGVFVRCVINIIICSLTHSVGLKCLHAGRVTAQGAGLRRSPEASHWSLSHPQGSS